MPTKDFLVVLQIFFLGAVHCVIPVHRVQTVQRAQHAQHVLHALFVLLRVLGPQMLPLLSLSISRQQQVNTIF